MQCENVKNFLILFVRFQCDLRKKKKKVITLTEASFSLILCLSPKKKNQTEKEVLRLSSASFLCDLCDIPERGAVYRSCLRFLARNKIASFWQEKKRRNLQMFNAKMPEKILHFFALIGNTDRECKCVASKFVVNHQYKKYGT